MTANEKLDLLQQYMHYFIAYKIDAKYKVKPLSFYDWIFYKTNIVPMNEWTNLVHHKEIWLKKYYL